MSGKPEDGSEVLTPEYVIKKLTKVRERRSEAKAEWETKDRKYAEIIAACECWLMERMTEVGVDQFKVAGVGTAYLTTETRPGCSDWDVFNTWAVQTGNVAMYQRRLSMPNIKQWMEDNGGELPPAVALSSERVVRVRKDTKV